MYMPAQIQHKMVKMVEIEPESAVQAQCSGDLLVSELTAWDESCADASRVEERNRQPRSLDRVQIAKHQSARAKHGR